MYMDYHRLLEMEYLIVPHVFYFYNNNYILFSPI